MLNHGNPSLLLSAEVITWGDSAGGGDSHLVQGELQQATDFLLGIGRTELGETMPFWGSWL